MKDQKNLWIIKAEDGHIKGPYTTEQVLGAISKGVLSGEEEVAGYPGGKWIPIAHSPEFYDHLLEALSLMTPNMPGAADSDHDENDEVEISQLPGDKTPHPSSPIVPSEKYFDEETKPYISPVTQGNNNGNALGEAKSLSQLERPSSLPAHNKGGARGIKTNEATNTDVRKPPSTTKTKITNIIDLSDVAAIQATLRKKNVLFASIVVVVSVLAGIIFINPGGSKSEKIHLDIPRKNQSQLNDAEVKTLVQKGVSNFTRHTFSGYQKAQGIFLKAVEGAPRNLEAVGMLCLTYRELWPFTYQDSTDLKAISTALQWAQNVDPIGIHTIHCRLTEMIAQGRHQEARSVVEKALETYVNGAILYEIKGSLSGEEKDYQTAIAYVRKTQQLWPAWLKSFFLDAEYSAKADKSGDAATIYRAILEKNPQHALAKLQLGILEKKVFNHEDTALELLNAAVDSGERFPKLVEMSAFMSLADLYSTRKEKDKALRFAKKAYAINSSNSEARDLIIRLGGMSSLNNTKVQETELIFLGDQYVRAGDHIAAQAVYKSAFESDGKNGMAALKAAKSLWELNQSEEAIDWLKKAISADPKLIGSYVIMADYYSQKYNYTEAYRILDRAQQVAKQNYEVYRGYAMVELRRNNFKGAQTYAQRALKYYDSDVDTFIILAKANLGLNDPKEARRYSARALELDPTYADAQITYAQVMAAVQGVDSGIYYLNELITKYSYVVTYRMAVAEMMYKDERYKEAVPILQTIVAAQANNRKARLLLGRTLQQIGKFDGSLSEYLSAATLDPSNPEPLFYAGLLYTETNRPELAIQQFERVLRVNPNYPRAHYFIGKAALLMKVPNVELAVKEAELERKINPNIADAYLLAAEAYDLAGQFSNCATEYQKAIKLRSQGAEIYVNMAKCYRLSGSLDVAKSMLELAAQKESGYPNIYREQGAVFEMQGNLSAAAVAYEKYLALSPNAKDGEVIRSKIQALGR